MRRFNKRGSLTMAVVLFVAVMVVSLQFLSVASTQRSTVSRHADQVENIYTYSSVAEILAGAVQRTFKSYEVTAPKTLLSGYNIYQELAQELRGKFILGDNEYSLFSPEELLQSSSPQDRDAASFMMDIIEDDKLYIHVSVDNLFVPDLNSEGNIFNFKTGDRLYFKPYVINVNISDISSSLSKKWEVRGVYAKIDISDSEIKLIPVFDDAVIRMSEALYQ